MKRMELIGGAIFLLFFTGSMALQNEEQVWNNRRCAVVLTYDDGLNIHLDQVIPALDSMGFKGTFYAPGYAPAINERIPEWRAAAENGHELGNHTLFHPCIGNTPGREWVPSDYAMENYTIGRMVDEIRQANVLLKAIDGKSERTFAYTCGDMTIADSSFAGLIHDDFVAARGVTGRMEMITTVDLFDIGSYMMSGSTGSELIELVKQAQHEGAMLVFLFHGVGGEHAINIPLEAHRELLHYLKENEQDIWVAPLVTVGEYIQEHRKPLND